MDSLSISMKIPTEDAEILEQIFKSEEEPRFVITKIQKLGCITEIEMFFDTSCNLLFVFKKVQRMLSFEKKRGEIPELVHLQMDNFNLKKEIQELKNKNQPI
jgi:hypothetical protein